MSELETIFKDRVRQDPRRRAFVSLSILKRELDGFAAHFSATESATAHYVQTSYGDSRRATDLSVKLVSDAIKMDARGMQRDIDIQVSADGELIVKDKIDYRESEDQQFASAQLEAIRESLAPILVSRIGEYRSYKLAQQYLDRHNDNTGDNGGDNSAPQSDSQEGAVEGAAEQSSIDTVLTEDNALIAAFSDYVMTKDKMPIMQALDELYDEVTALNAALVSTIHENDLGFVFNQYSEIKDDNYLLYKAVIIDDKLCIDKMDPADSSSSKAFERNKAFGGLIFDTDGYADKDGRLRLLFGREERVLEAEGKHEIAYLIGEFSLFDDGDKIREVISDFVMKGIPGVIPYNMTPYDRMTETTGLLTDDQHQTIDFDKLRRLTVIEPVTKDVAISEEPVSKGKNAVSWFDKIVQFRG